MTQTTALFISIHEIFTASGQLVEYARVISPTSTGVLGAAIPLFRLNQIQLKKARHNKDKVGQPELGALTSPGIDTTLTM